MTSLASYDISRIIEMAWEIGRRLRQSKKITVFLKRTSLN